MTAEPAPDSPFYGNYMPDCIHIHACRRVQAIAKSRGMKVPRFCSENCECYQSFSDDVYCSIDLEGEKLSVILEDCDYEL